MKKTKIAAAALAAVMSVSMLPQTTALPSLGVTASAASTSSKLAAPTGIKTSVSETQIKLSWNEVDGADAYIIYKYNSSTKKYEQYKSVFGTNCTVKELTAGTKYYFKVAALVKVNGKYTVQTKSAAVSATTAKASSKLAAPTGIKTSVSENKIQLSWNKVSGADAYIIYKYDSATKTLKQYKSITGTTCTVTGLTAGTKYYFKVAALVKTNGKYTVQTKSNYVSVTTKASSKLAAPTGIKTSVSETQVEISWNAVSGADKYIVYKYNSSSQTFEQYKTMTDTTCTVKDLTAGTTYKFKVAALVKADGKYTVQTKSDEILATTAKTASKLAAPTGIKTSVSETQVEISWNEVDGADAYIIYKYNSSTKKYEQYERVSGTSCTVEDLTSDTTYKFKVAALVKTDGKYTVQTKSDSFSATTKSSVNDVSGEPRAFDMPETGALKDDVLRDCGIANYTYSSSTNSYRGEVLFLGIKSEIVLFFNDDDTISFFDVETPCTYSYYTDVASSFKSAFKDAFYSSSYDYKDGVTSHSWLGGGQFIFLSYVKNRNSLYLTFTY